MISISGLSVAFRGFGLHDVNLKIDSGDYFMLVGPTGAGKTILLETIAGLHEVKSGEIWINEREMTRLEPEKRNIGMVYQDCALFPHLSVGENIVFGLKVRHVNPVEIKDTLGDIVSLVGVGNLINRKPDKLSGGEKQKVALARALAIRPGLLLLDEPLSALDPETREMLQVELKRIHHELNIMVIHVTHDFNEALVLGKYIAVIGNGKIMQTGTPDDVFRKPGSEFVARFTMVRNIFTGELISRNEGTVFRTGNMELVTITRKDGATHACIRPDDVSLSTDVISRAGINNFVGVIARIEDRGENFHIIVKAPLEICCGITRRDFLKMELKSGQKVKVSIDPEAVHVF